MIDRPMTRGNSPDPGSKPLRGETFTDPASSVILCLSGRDTAELHGARRVHVAPSDPRVNT